MQRLDRFGERKRARIGGMPDRRLARRDDQRRKQRHADARNRRAPPAASLAARATRSGTPVRVTTRRSAAAHRACRQRQDRRAPRRPSARAREDRRSSCGIRRGANAHCQGEGHRGKLAESKRAFTVQHSIERDRNALNFCRTLPKLHEAHRSDVASSRVFVESH